MNTLFKSMGIVDGLKGWAAQQMELCTEHTRTHKKQFGMVSSYIERLSFVVDS